MGEDEACLQEVEPPKECHQCFPTVRFQDSHWDLRHLDSFAFRSDIGFEATVIVLFSCHCFSRSLGADTRSQELIPPEEIYRDNREIRVLDPLRYWLSRRYLRQMVLHLPKQHIVCAGGRNRNFMTWRVRSEEGLDSIYAAFFSVERDRRRKARLIMRLQSAYPLDDGLSASQRNGRKVRLHTLLKAAYEGRTIKA
ncbi:MULTISPECIES: hypothetical protein [unclassified Cupriavidus]|uniref:hypothetical protein n=1 Tax=unclassified Cupriavidus TaxID=2640874 RepID=UPI0010F855FA|nr:MULTISPECIES: hypothetical protein [unclassified Cupriavidus]MWL89832.1 hypothetical protein [Cupriavidus sp. SW-Y-13]